MSTELSVIIPVLHEGKRVNTLIRDLAARPAMAGQEILVADGTSDGTTLSAIDPGFVARITGLLSRRGRAVQMNAAAARAKGGVLLFLHADTLLPHKGIEQILDCMADPAVAGGAFDLGIDSGRLPLKVIARMASFRSRITRLPYGDQAIFLRRRLFDALGGFREIPVCEDLDLMRRIKRGNNKLRILGDPVRTSARRWEKEGIVYTTLRNWILTLLFLTGMSPARLGRWYRPYKEAA